MFNNPAITWALTAVLLLSGGYYLLQAARSRHLTDRANKSLHALMSVLMAAMLWNLVPSTMLAQIAVLAGAALWFVIQAVARPEFNILCAGSQNRLKCVYHSLTMAGAALMIAMMGQAAAGSREIAPAVAMSTPHAHHATAPAAHSTVVSGLDHSSVLALPLTVFFGIAAVVFTVLLLRGRAATATAGCRSTPKRSVRAEHGLEALGAAVMALMFATMSA
ncbi:hypothetical protein J2X01_004077 [Arthrobacter ginsengisoli]|uniref:DUF5134 domain-containing protein n=1 Tax=Arthrobacter ginsengisoli TaxID=1356565 RepID=A0ABU1UI00_9MICC|nr:DUF5134 domain-containing protein [Arthrobacter ginsengisoli]MDR7084760.1 hypothetical protein [Arthrobacter ginsengisoli]